MLPQICPGLRPLLLRKGNCICMDAVTRLQLFVLMTVPCYMIQSLNIYVLNLKEGLHVAMHIDSSSRKEPTKAGYYVILIHGP